MKARGFTLTEVLVAAVITVMLAGLLLGAVVQVLNVWGRATGVLATAGQAAFVLDQLTADLEAAVLRPDAGVWFAATVQRDQAGTGDSGMNGAAWSAPAKPPGAASLALAPPSGRIEDMHFGQAGVWLRFFTAQPDANDSANNRSLPRAVSYQIVRRRVGAVHVYQLFRSQVRPGGANSTFSAGYDLFASAYSTGNATEQHPGNVRRPNVRFLLGNHVVDFGLRLYARAADGSLVPVFPDGPAGEQTLAATTDPAAVPPGYAGRPVVRAWPAAAEVMVRVLTEEGARLVDNHESGRTSGPAGVPYADHWWRLVEAHSHVYVRRIELRGTVY